jgi:hypothetical protein
MIDISFFSSKVFSESEESKTLVGPFSNTGLREAFYMIAEKLYRDFFEEMDYIPGRKSSF